MHRATPSRLACLFLFVLTLGGCEPRQHLVEQHLLEFGTIIEITMITGDLNHAEHLLTEIEHRLSIHREQWHAWEDSDLTRFNAALSRNSKARVPSSLASLLRLSRDYYDASRGLFNPALGKLVAAYGFHGREADMNVVAAIRRDIPGMHDLDIDSEIAVSSNPHLQIDLGGIAKGYAVGLISRYLDDNGIDDYIINAGGDMAIAGNRFGRPWRIGIRNPFAPGVVASLEIVGKHNLFTSGNYERQYRRGKNRAHHIIDPRSGEPATGQSSATVLSNDPVRADVAATAMMINGFQGHRALAKSLHIEDYIVIGESRQIVVSRALADKIKIAVSWPTTIIY
ncbi:MAG: FAD:protein FMN transferase [Gammaproteobacteria bacterium]|nr:FAD:protein FMN transferase [Gammaproteobacteria bacterium]